MAAGRLFDAYVMVDWSAAAKPSPSHGRDSIWLGIARAPGGAVELENPRTRHLAVERLLQLLSDLRREGRRVLVGFDFPFGYPAGTAARLTGKASWRALWEWIAQRLDDGPDNRNNRYLLAESINAQAFDGRGPFWGNPGEQRFRNLPPTRPSGYGERYPAERRFVEQRVRSAHVVWKLVGAGQVGGQVLTGLPAVLRLRDEPAFAGAVAIWPFEAGAEAAALPPVVFAEIYPSLESLPDGAEVKDARQVRAVVEALEAADRAGELAALLAAPWRLPEPERRAVVEEEAWILNLRPQEPAPAGGQAVA